MAYRTSKGEFDRRTFIRSMALVATGVGGSSLITSCATGGSDESGERSSEVTEGNPLGVDPVAPLDVVIFDGGWGHAYAQEHETIYQAAYPDAEITHTATQEITSVLQPRFVNGNPPDMVNNAGAQAMDVATLVNNGQLVELSTLLDAPSLDIEGVTVGESLIEGATDANIFTHDGEEGVYGIDYVLNVPGIWYDAKLFRDRSWEYPKTWSELLEFGEATAAEGIPLWIYQGQHPSYMLGNVFNPMLQKHGGPDVLRDIDNLEDGAWESDAVRDTLEALHQLKVRELIRPGTAGLTHIESQAAWLEHEALLIPCGSWLENEMRDQIPDDFELTVAPTPSLTDSDALPFQVVPYAAATTFVVPADGNNVAGGLELLRIMLSREGAQKFAELNSALTIVEGAHEDQDLGSTVASSVQVLENARQAERLDVPRYENWYGDLRDEARQALGAMLTADLDPAGFVERVQAKADEVRDDDMIEKFSR